MTDFVITDTFKNLTVLKCRHCNTSWLQENEGSNRFCYKLSLPYQFDLLNEWKTNPLDASHVRVAAELIGYST
jgi:hypothetical protein